MRAWLARSGAALLAEPPEVTAGLLAAAQQARGYSGSAEQQGAWEAQIAALREAIRAADAPFHDATRDAATLDAIAAFLSACGARPLAACPAPPGGDMALLPL